MKTRDRILHASLLLFNEEGEPGTTTVDIANELDISPGNLYYHFRGKDVIIGELFLQFERGLGEVLGAPLQRPLGVEDNWLYLYVVFEEMYNYRFIYHNLGDLLERYPALRRRFRRILGQKRSAVRAVLQTFAHAAGVTLGGDESKALVTNMVALLTHWLTFTRLQDGERTPAQVIHQGVYQLMSMLAPHLGASHRAFHNQVRNLYHLSISPKSAP